MLARAPFDATVTPPDLPALLRSYHHNFATHPLRNASCEVRAMHHCCHARLARNVCCAVRVSRLNCPGLSFAIPLCAGREMHALLFVCRAPVFRPSSTHQV